MSPTLFQGTQMCVFVMFTAGKKGSYPTEVLKMEATVIKN